MKKWLLLALLPLAIFSENSFGQCTPDPNHTSELVYPLPDQISYSATEGTYFEEVITLNIPEDTSIVFGGFPVTATIDSAILSTITGFPNGVSHECNPSSCVFIGNTSGCIKISGTPTESGTFTIKPTIIVFYTAVGTQSTLTIDTLAYTMDVNPVGIEDLTANNELSLLQNPVENNVKVALYSDVASQSTVNVYNLLGEIVYREQRNILAGLNTIELQTAHLASGQYILVIEKDGAVISEKFNKQ